MAGVGMVAVIGCGGIEDDRGQIVVFFFQAEDGIRDYKVTGVQTCALPIFSWRRSSMTPQEQEMLQGLVQRVNQTQLSEKDPDAEEMLQQTLGRNPDALYILEIGRASCRERV